MRPNGSRGRTIAGLLAVAILSIPGGAGLVQQDSSAVRKEPSGLIRGDRLPQSRVRVDEDVSVWCGRLAEDPSAADPRARNESSRKGFSPWR